MIQSVGAQENLHISGVVRVVPAELDGETPRGAG